MIPKAAASLFTGIISTFATTLTLTNGVPIETVGRMPGHKNSRTTRHYARVADTRISRDMQPLKIKYRDSRFTCHRNWVNFVFCLVLPQSI